MANRQGNTIRLFYTNISFSYLLPDEIVIMILNFCDDHTLSQISMVCKQFNRISREILNKRSNYLLATNQMSEKFRERCKPLLSTNFKHITYYNWINAKCKRSQIYEEQCRNDIDDYTPSHKCLHMTENIVWFRTYTDGKLLAYNRAKDGTIENSNTVESNFCIITFITIITHCNDEIISGHLNGAIIRTKVKSTRDKINYLTYTEIHNVHERINEMDATSQHIIISAETYENSIKILKYTDDKDGCTEEKKIFNGYHESWVTSILFDPAGTKFACSSRNNFCESLFLLYDLNKCCPIIDDDELYDDVCTQLLWEDPHTILMCNFTSIRKMDIRTSKIVRTWDAAPIDGFFYCISSDNLYTFITGGTKGILWDQRQSVPIQTYIVDDKKKSIRYLEFDSTQLYAATEDGLFELDFTARDHFDHKK